MVARRQIWKKRIGPDGVEVHCESEPESYIDIKETTKTKYERGKGFKQQITVYWHRGHCGEITGGDVTIRLYDDEPKITFINVNNSAVQIPYLKTKGPFHGVVKSIRVQAAKGAAYQKTKVSYCNDISNSTRKVRVQRVENENDPSVYIDVERITEFSTESGKGANYQKKRVRPRNSEEAIKAQTGPCKPITSGSPEGPTA